MNTSVIVQTVYFRFIPIGLILLNFLGGAANASAVETNCTSLIEGFSTRIALPNDELLLRCLPAIQSGAEAGNIKAVVVKGYMSGRGVGMKRSARNARKAFELGSKAGLPVADYLLGSFYIGRLGARLDDFLKAENLLKKAIKAGELSASTALAELYRSGKLGDKSVDEIDQLFQQSPTTDTVALVGRAKLLMIAQGAERDVEKALNLFKQAAVLGNHEAQFRFGVYWMARKGGMREQAQALDFLKQAAAADYHPAQYWLGVFQLSSQNKAEQAGGLQLVRLAAKAGNAEALNSLGDFYFRGEHVPANFGFAKQFWFKAAQAGSDPAKLSLLYQYEKLSHDEVLRLNGAYSYAQAFTTDIGLVMLGNYYLARVQRGQNGEYIKSEYTDYWYARDAFTLAAKSPIEAIAKPAATIATKLRRNADAFKKDLKARRQQRKTQFWIGAAVTGIAILSLFGRNAPNYAPGTTPFDPCAGINGLGLFGSSWGGAAAAAGCRPF